jgi:general secretion pathway protein B
MSFILDALRKSEAERQDGRPPGLADVRRATPRSRAALWAPLAIIVLVANLLLLWLIWRGQASAPAAVAMPPATPPAAGMAAPQAPAAVPRDAPAAAASPSVTPPVSAPELAREVRPLARETLPRTPPAPAAAPAALPATPRVTESIPTVEELDLPRLEELVGSGRLNLPPLALELHVWSEQPASRFVFINSARYREGERLAEGPVVEQIITGGVVLSQGGERFVLSRP